MRLFGPLKSLNLRANERLVQNESPQSAQFGKKLVTK